MGSTAFDFRGDVVAVTGAARGLGLATAELFARSGSTVVILDVDGDAAGDAAERLRDQGLDASSLLCDVTQDDSVSGCAAEIGARHGRCDVLVNNAGVIVRGALEAVSTRDWQRVLDINLSGQFRCLREFGRLMLERGSGVIINISSISAHAPSAFSGAYSATKAGVTMLTRQAAVEWGHRGVRVNAVQPGMMTSNLAGIFTADQMRQRAEAAKQAVPLGRLGDVGEVAQVIAFLASSASSYISGESIEVDGGLLQGLSNNVPRPGALP
jgi:NAD(P)-dependent dehydrogenase (short-subunit alcohol dehydrogenase family)